MSHERIHAPGSGGATRRLHVLHPTEAEEQDGTYTWSKTILVVVESKAGGTTGLGYTYASHASAVSRMRHAEYFYDHVRIESMLFDGVPEPRNGALQPDLSRPGHGLEFKYADARRFAS